MLEDTPGTVRWKAGDDRFYLEPEQHNHFVLGQEFNFGDGAFTDFSLLVINRADTPELLDRLAEFNGLPKYSDLSKTQEAVNHILNRLDSPIYSSGVFKGAIKRELRMALEGKKVDDD
jgi:hypothetical protein